MRIILILLAILPLAAMWYDIYLNREQQAREQAFLASAEALLTEELQVGADQSLADPIVLPPDREGQAWGLRGKLILPGLDQQPARQRIGARFDAVCETAEDPACWKLVSLTVNGDDRPFGSLAVPIDRAAADDAETEAAETADSDGGEAETADTTDPATPSPENGGEGGDLLPAPASQTAAADGEMSAEAEDPADDTEQPAAISIALNSDSEADGVSMSPEELAATEPETEPAPTAAEAPPAADEAPTEDGQPAPALPSASEIAALTDEPQPETASPPTAEAAAEPETEVEAEEAAPDATEEPMEASVEQSEEETPEPPKPDRAMIANVQSALNTLGYGKPRPLSVDGVLGPQTNRAIRAYRQDNGLAGGETVTAELLGHMAARIESQTSTEAAAPSAAPQPQPQPQRQPQPAATQPGIASMTAPSPNSSATYTTQSGESRPLTETNAADPATATPATADPAPAETATAEPANAEPATAEPAPQTAALPADSETADSTSAGDRSANADESLVYLIQDRLLRLGHPGAESLARSGKLDQRTVTVITSYQEANALTADGQPSESLLRHLESALRQSSQSGSAASAQ